MSTSTPSLLSYLSRPSLPTPVLLHALSLSGIGLYLVARPPPPPQSQSEPQNDKSSTSTSSSTSSYSWAWPLTLLSSHIKNPLSAPPGRAHELSSLVGVFASALGVTYLLTSSVYPDWRRNQWLYVSVPIRLWVAGLSAGKLLLERWRGYGISEEGKTALWFAILYDGIGAAGLGWWLSGGGGGGDGKGVWVGRCPG